MEVIHKILSRTIFRPKKNKESEIAVLLSSTEKMTPDEITQYLHNKFSTDLEMFKRLVKEQEQRNEEVKSFPPIKLLLEKLMPFYKDLILDGIIKKDFSLFERNELSNWKVGQSRKEASEYLEKIKSIKDSYRQIFINFNHFYVINYESLIGEYLLVPAQRIERKEELSKGRAIAVLLKYKEGKHSELFKCLIPQIRNSIDHRDFIIDPKQPKITFHDKDKPPMTLSVDEYREIIETIIPLTLAFDTMDFELKLPILRHLLDKIDIVSEYLKKNDLKIEPIEGGLSILDLSLLIESGKIK